MMMVDEGVLANNALEKAAAEQAGLNNMLEARAANVAQDRRLEVLAIVAGTYPDGYDTEALLDAAEVALQWVLTGERTVIDDDTDDGVPFESPDDDGHPRNDIEAGAWDDGK